MEGEGSRQAAPDGGSGGEEGSHTHCVVAVMGTRDFWLKDFCRAPKSWVQLHPPPLQPLGFACWGFFGVSATSVAAKKHQGFYACFALHKEKLWNRYLIY